MHNELALNVDASNVAEAEVVTGVGNRLAEDQAPRASSATGCVRRKQYPRGLSSIFANMARVETGNAMSQWFAAFCWFILASLYLVSRKPCRQFSLGST